MAFFMLCATIAVIGLTVAPPDPALPVPPAAAAGPACVDLTSALAMTRAFNLIQFECMQQRIEQVGGEEFVLLMPDNDLPQALIVAERLRAAIGASPLAAGTPVVTVSAGVTGLINPPAGLDQDALFGRADASLYRTKLERNCVRSDIEPMPDVVAPLPSPVAGPR